VERPIRVLLADERERGSDLLAELRRHYAVHMVHDDGRLLHQADQARTAGQPYDLMLIATDLPELGSPQTLQRLRVMAPTTILIPMIAAAGAAAPPPGPGALSDRYLLQPVEPETALELIGRLLADRRAELARGRTELLRPLIGLGDALLRQPDLERALRQLYHALDGLIPSEHRYIALLDRQRDRLVYPLSYDHGEYVGGHTRAFRPGQGLAEWVITHDTPLVSGNFPGEAQQRGWPPGDADNPFLPMSTMVLPLHLGAQVIGVLGASSARPDAFHEAELTLFGFVADLLAGVVAHWWTDLQWQRQSDLLAQFDRALATNADPATILAATVDAARKLTAMDSATVIGRTPDGYEPYPVSSGAPADQFNPVLAALTAQLLTPRPPGGPVDHTQTSTLLANLGARGVGRVVSHALGSAGHVEAMLWLLHPTERPFGVHDQAALAAVGRRSGQALATSAGTTAHHQEREVFARIAWRAAQETNLVLLLSSALNEVGKLIPWAGTAVWQEDSRLHLLRRLWSEGTQAVLGGRPLPADDPLFGVAGERNQVLLLDEHDAAAGADAAPHGPAVAVSLRGYSSAQTAGLLVLERARGAPPFTADDAALLLRLGQLLASALEKLRWFVLADLHRRLTQALASPPARMWDRIVAAVSSNLPDGGIAVLAPDTERWRPLAAALGAQPGPGVPWDAAGQTLLGALQNATAPVLYDGAALARHGITGVGSLVLTPIPAGGTLVGALAFWSARPYIAGDREIELLTHAAGHLAPALWVGQQGGGQIQSRRLLALIETLHQEAGAVANAPGLLHHLLLHTLSNTPATVGAVLLRGAGDRLMLQASYPRQSDSLPPEAYQGAVAALRLGQAQYLSGPTGTLACIPLQGPLHADHTSPPLGVLVIGSPHQDAFGASERELLAHLAAQGAILIGDHQAHDAARALRSVTGLAVPRAQVLARVPALICHALNVPVCLIHVLDRREDRFVLAGCTGVNPAAPALAALALPSDHPGLDTLFAAAPDQLDGPAAPGAQLWSPRQLEDAGLHYSLAVPIWVDGRPFGLVSLHTLDSRPLGSGSARVLATLCADLGVVLEGLQQEQRLSALTALSASLIEVGTGGAVPAALTPDGTVSAALERLLSSALEITDTRAAYLLLRRPAPPWLVLQATAGEAVLAPGAPPPMPVEHLLELTGPRYLSDLQLFRPEDHPIFDPATRSSLALPLLNAAAAGDRVLGAILIESPTPVAVSQDDYRVLQAIAALAAGLVIQQGLVQQLQAQPQQIHGLLDTLTGLLDETDENPLYLRVVLAARQALGADLVVLHPWNGGGPLLEVPPQSGNQQAGALAGSLAMQTLVRQVLTAAATRANQPLFVEQLPAHSDPTLPEWIWTEAVQALALVPLVTRAGLVGLLFVAYRRPLHFDAVRREAMRLFAILAAIALKNAQAQTEATAALHAQMQCLSLAAHELREPVDKVHMIIETALNGLWLPMSDTLRERLSVAYTALDDHYEVLGRVLQLGRLQSRMEDLARQPIALADLVQAVIGRHADYARAQGVVLQAAIDPLLVPQRPLLDDVLLSTALGNLVHNAVKFSPAGGQVLLLCTSRYAEGQRQLIITVEDAGIGIPAAALDQIFAPYYQADHSLGRRGSGMGLGLTLARLIVDLHGGTLTVESVPDEGSRFTVQLPFLSA